MAYYRILHGNAPFDASRFFLLGHIRGCVLFTNRLDKESGAIDLSHIPDGILSLVLLDEAQVPYSERLVFVRNSRIDCQVSPDRSTYESRSPVSLDITLKDDKGNPLQGKFSMSITDNYAVDVDSTAGNILSQLLLTSDLKGYIDSPGYYFTGNTPQLQACLDNVMLTHGWSRFRVEEILQQKKPAARYAVETEQTITGIVKNSKNKPSPSSAVLVKVKDKSAPPLLTDADGRFSLVQNTLRDTTLVTAHAIEMSFLLLPTSWLMPTRRSGPMSVKSSHPLSRKTVYWCCTFPRWSSVPIRW